MEKQITVTKVALSAGMFLKAGYKEHLPNNDERIHPPVSMSAPVHEELTSSFKEFIPHLALICEEISNEQFIECLPEEEDATQGHVVEMGELVPAIKATRANKSKKKSGLTVSMKGPDGSEKDISSLFGDKEEVQDILDNFDVSDVDFKFMAGIEAIQISGSKRLSTGDWMSIKAPWIKINGPYRYNDMLFQSGELLKFEVTEYILNHKYAPPVDPELPFGNGTGIEEEQY